LLTGIAAGQAENHIRFRIASDKTLCLQPVAVTSVLQPIPDCKQSSENANPVSFQAATIKNLGDSVTPSIAPNHPIQR